MDKERLFGIEDGFSEKDLDLAVDKQGSDDQVKGANVIFDPQQQQKNKKPQPAK